jgi:hypothetical protein
MAVGSLRRQVLAGCRHDRPAGPAAKGLLLRGVLGQQRSCSARRSRRRRDPGERLQGSGTGQPRPLPDFIHGRIRQWIRSGPSECPSKISRRSHRPLPYASPHRRTRVPFRRPGAERRHPGAPAEFAASPRRDDRYGHAAQNWVILAGSTPTPTAVVSAMSSSRSSIPSWLRWRRTRPGPRPHQRADSPGSPRARAASAAACEADRQTQARGLSPSPLRTFATTGHPPAGLALEVTGQAQTRRGCLMRKHRQAGLSAIRR